MVWRVFLWSLCVFLLCADAQEVNISYLEDLASLEYNVTALEDNETATEYLVVETKPEEVHLRWVSQAMSEAILDFAPSSKRNVQCESHSKLYLQDLKNLTVWAVQMLDASAQSISGVLGAGRTHSLGNFDQCLQVKEPRHQVAPQYCLAEIKYAPTREAYPGYYTPMSDAYYEPSGDESVWEKIKVTGDERIVRRDIIYWALCVPVSCSAEDIEASFNDKVSATFQKYSMNASLRLDEKACQNSEKKPLPTSAVVAWIIIVILIVTPILSTIYDRNFAKEKDSSRSGLLEKVIMAFSFRVNMNDLIKKSSNREYDIINGIKVITIILILGGHRLMYTLGNSLINGERWEGESLIFRDMIFFNSPYLVDTFFVFGGYLTFVGVYKQVEKTKRLNLHNLILMRWLRQPAILELRLGFVNETIISKRVSKIVPAFLVVMMFYALTLPYFSDGPLWPFRPELESRRCREHWWLNLLFLNNYIHADDQCHILSWYLACDMHLFILSCVLVYALWKSPRFGEILCAILLAASCVIPFMTVYDQQLFGTFRMFVGTLWDPYKDDFFSTVYVKTHHRAGPYIAGVIGAYICSKLNDANYKFSKISLVLGTIVFVGIGHASQWYSQQFYDNTRPYSAWENALYVAFHKLIYSLGINWIIISYSTNRVVLFKRIFGWRFYEPLARLVYCMVLVHPGVQLILNSSIRSPQYIAFYQMLWMSAGDVLTSLVLSLILYLCVEAPYRNLQKIFLMPQRRPKRPEEVIMQHTVSVKL